MSIDVYWFFQMLHVRGKSNEKNMDLLSFIAWYMWNCRRITNNLCHPDPTFKNAPLIREDRRLLSKASKKAQLASMEPSKKLHDWSVI